MYDFITIGSATQDVFVQSDVASIVSVSQIEKKSEFMSFPYGAKTEIADFSKNLGGGAVNTATNLANLGFKTSTIIKLGNDELNKTIREEDIEPIKSICKSKKDKYTIARIRDRINEKYGHSKESAPNR